MRPVTALRLVRRQDTRPGAGQARASVRRTRCLIGDDLRRVHREAAQAHGQQQLGERRVARHLAADADVLAGALAPRDGAARPAAAPPDARGRRDAPRLRRRDRSPACTGSGRWCRSRRSRSGAGSVGSISAAAGTSIIAPTSTSAYGTPSVAQLLLGARERLERLPDLDSGAPPSGSAGAPCRSALARRMARSCWRNIAGSDRLQRIARRPERRVERVLVAQLVHRHAVERLVGADVDRADRHRQAVHRLDRHRGVAARLPRRPPRGRRRLRDRGGQRPARTATATAPRWPASSRRTRGATTSGSAASRRTRGSSASGSPARNYKFDDPTDRRTASTRPATSARSRRRSGGPRTAGRTVINMSVDSCRPTCRGRDHRGGAAGAGGAAVRGRGAGRRRGGLGGQPRREQLLRAEQPGPEEPDLHRDAAVVLRLRALGGGDGPQRRPGGVLHPGPVG